MSVKPSNIMENGMQPLSKQKRRRLGKFDEACHQVIHYVFAPESLRSHASAWFEPLAWPGLREGGETFGTPSGQEAHFSLTPLQSPLPSLPHCLQLLQRQATGKFH